MKSILLTATFLCAVSGAAFAADTVEVAPVSAGFIWTGGYVGLQAAYGWGDTRFDDGATSNWFDVDGFAGGLTAGYNVQFAGNWVAGIEADLSISGVDGAFGPGNLGQPDGSSWGCGSDACTTDVDWYATARARLGYAFDNLLVYGTGGLAIGRVKSQIVDDLAFYVSDTNIGWSAGAGVEYALNQNWSVKAEYLHVDLGWTELANDFFKSETKFDTVRLGVNYRF